MKKKILYKKEPIEAKVISDFLPISQSLHLHKKAKRKGVDKKFLKLLDKVIEEHDDVLRELAKR